VSAGRPLWRWFSVAVGLWLLGALAVAQPAPEPAPEAVPQTPPKGPADVIGGARQAREQRDMQRAGQQAGATQAAPAAAPEPPAQTAPVESGQGPAGDPHGGNVPAGDPHGGDPHAGASPHSPGAAGPQAQQRPLSEAQADTSLPLGTIVVRVLDEQERPVAGAAVRVGIMKSDSTRDAKNGKTDASGVARFEGLQAGDRQAYRVSVPYEGATYGATPFRLPPRGGYSVTIRRLPVTGDGRMVVLYVGATSVEFKDERLKVVQQARLLNIGQSTYVFPEAGTLVQLPKGFLAFQTQPSMSDQRLVEAEGEGMRVQGSLPPGEATLLWGYDLPIEGEAIDLSMPLPWLTMAYRVVVDAPEGLSLSVEEMPEPTLHSEGGKRFLVTEVQRRVGDQPFKHLRIRLSGIPGPGPERVIATLLALVLLLGGAFYARGKSPAESPERLAADLGRRRGELLVRAQELGNQRRADAIGPEYHAEQLEELTDAMAVLLMEEARQAAAAKAGKAGKAKPGNPGTPGTPPGAPARGPA